MSNPYEKIAANRRPLARRSASRTNERLSARKVMPRTRRQEEGFDTQGNFNPQSFDYASSVRRAVSTNTDRRRMFDSNGEINAYDKKDALTQIAHLLQTSTKRHASDLSFNKQADDIKTKEARRDILAAALQDSEGFRIVGQELALPIKDILDYEGFSRKIFRVRKLAQAELFRVPLDIRSVAYVLGQDGKTPRDVIKTKWVLPKETKIASFPVVDISDIYMMNFDVLDRAQDTARQEIELNEDKRGIALVDAASQAINTVTTFATLGVAAFEDVRFQVERHRMYVEQYLINRAELSDIVKTMSAAVDPVTERELILSGYIGNFVGARILTAAGTGQQEVIPAGTFYACVGPEYLGEMGIRIELFSEPFNEYATQRTTKGWAFVEQVGYAIPNAKTCAKGSK
jgi:hypothetical protein